MNIGTRTADVPLPVLIEEDVMAVGFDELVARYLEMWNETDPARRRRAIDELWAPDGRYVDPLVVADGRDAIDATIAAVHSQFPGMRFRPAGPVDGHHNQVRFTWELGPDGVAAPIAGFDVAVTDGDGRLRQVLGFLDRVPAGGAPADPASAAAGADR